ncbi:MAG: chemotaxis protein CheW, partial [Desulfobacterales bacterium]|nr:chemotaxis protein CheW [Desulfobacterales bacterium]
MKLFVFKSKDGFIGIESDYVHRIIDDSKITPIPLTPGSYTGLLYHRGELFDVINMRLLGYPADGSAETTRIIILNWLDKKLAVIPDEIVGMIWIDDNSGNINEYYHEERKIRLMKPDDIWKKLSELSYGPH